MPQPSLPFREDSEKAFLCCLILRNTLIPRCETLDSAIFYIPANLILFRMLVDMSLTDQLIDFVLCRTYLSNQRQLDEIGGISYLNEVWSFVPSPEGWEHYLSILKDQHVRRRTILAARSLIQEMEDPQSDCIKSIQEIAESGLSAIVTEVRKKEKSFSDILNETIDYIESCSEEKAVRGAQFGIKTLDEQLGGLRCGEYMVIAAEVSVGKTALALQAGLIGTADNKRFAMFSFEMTASQVATRVLAHAGIRMSSIRAGRLSMEESNHLKHIRPILSDYPIHLADAFGMTINSVISQCRKWNAKHKLDLIIVDYIQLVTPSTNKSEANREREVADISRKLKILSGELDVPVIALSQLNDKGQMRESRAISQDADVILKIEVPDTAHDNFRDIIIEKQRNGPRGQKIPVQFLGQYVLFEDNPDAA